MTDVDQGLCSLSLDFLQIGMTVFNADRKMISWNRPAAHILGFSPDGELSAHPVFNENLQYILPEGTLLSKDAHPLSTVIRTGVPVRNFITGVDFKDKNIRKWLKINVFQQDNPYADVSGYVMLIEEMEYAGEFPVRQSRLASDDEVNPIIAVLPDIVLRINADYVFTYCHANTPEDLLIPENEVIGKRLEEVMPPELSPVIISKILSSKQNGAVETMEFSLQLARPEKQWFEARFITDGFAETVCVVRNITEKKRSEDALRENEQLLRDIFNYAPVPLVISSIEGQIVMVNDALEKLIGVPFSTFKNMNTLDFYQKSEDREIYIQRLKSHSRVRNQEISLKKLTGEPTPCLLSSELVMMNGQQMIFTGIVDISEQKKAEEERRQNEQLLRDIFNFSPIALIITRVESGAIVMANNAALKLAGGEEHEVIGKPVIDFYAVGEERSNLLADIAATGRSQREISLINLKNKFSSGLVSTNIINMNGEKMLFTGFIDITERKKMEAELNNSLNLVREQNKRLLNFSYIVSHNLRSHTGNIKTILDFFEKAQTEAEKEELFKYLRTVAKRLDETLYDLNDVVSIHNNIKLIIESLNLYYYVDRAMDVLHENAIMKNAVIRNLIPPDIEINYNPAYLESILLNLLSNAIKYSHPDRTPEITFEFSQENDKSILKISDNGMGIDLEKHGDKLFGMYKTFHGNKDSRGLGLFITKNQVEAMGGTIAVESNPDLGTTFKIGIL